MTRTRFLNARGKALAIGVCVVLGGGVLARVLPPIALINESPSLPRGLYLWIGNGPPRVADIVATPQPMSARPYLSHLGMPGEVLLIKRVGAQGGDRVCRARQHVEFGRRRLIVAERDRSGIPLPSWQECRPLAESEVFLVGDTTSSFDSRYFGPVKIDEITGTYREVLRW